MRILKAIKLVPTAILVLAAWTTAYAGEVKILAADFHKTGDVTWAVDVTLKHGDTGWEHYADKWRIVDSDGNVLGERVLLHPHVNEQPFTRGLGVVAIPAGVTSVYVEARDTVHGWSPDRLQADLSLARDGRLRVETKK